MTTYDEDADLRQLFSAQADADEPRSPRDPRRRRRLLRGLLIAVAVIVALVAAAGGYAWWALTAPAPAPTASTRTLHGVQPDAVELALPDDGASAFVVSGGREFFDAAATSLPRSSGSAAAKPIASIAKLITALVVLDAYPIAPDGDGPTITFDRADHALYDAYYVRGATIAPMPTGSSLSLRDALATMLIPSASNYAEAISTWAFGSPAGYAQAARRWLSAHGLAETTIVESTGLDARNTSTPDDLLEIGRLAAADPVITEIAATHSLTLPGPGAMYNTNDLLGTEGVTGLKTGNLGTGSYNLLYTAEIEMGPAGRLEVLGVVLGGETHDAVNAEVRALLASIRSGFRRVPLATKGEVVGSYSTPWGEEASLVVSKDASVFAWSDTPVSVSMQTTTPVSYTDGEVVGLVTWTAGSQTASATVELRGSIAPPTKWWRLTHPDQLANG